MAACIVSPLRFKVPEALERDLLRGWGCLEGQEFYFERPLPAAQVEVLLRHRATLPLSFPSRVPEAPEEAAEARLAPAAP
jgi:hypothetical protein